MASLGFGALAALIVLFAARGVQLLRPSSIGDILDDDLTDSSDQTKNGPVTRVIDALGRATQKIVSGIYSKNYLILLSRQLRAAGQSSNLTTQMFIQRQSGFVCMGLLLLILFSASNQIFVGIVVFVLMSSWMHAWLLISIRTRQESIEKDLPDFLDVLAVTVAAGLPFRTALDRVSDQHSGPLAEEMRMMRREMQLGVPRRTAMEGLRERNRSESVATFVTAILQSEELGTPLEDALRQIAQEVRRQHGQQVRRNAAKAQPKVSLVVTMMIVPGALILLIGGMLVSNWESIMGLFDV